MNPFAANQADGASSHPATLARRRSFAPWRSRRGRRGWIGIDVGAAAIKLAQVERRGDRHEIVARWTVPIEPGAPAREHPGGDLAWVTSLPQIRQARGLFRGRQAAAALSPSIARMRCLEIPTASHDELRRMIENELESDPCASPATRSYFDFWETHAPDAADSRLAQVAVVDVPCDVALQLASGLRSGGLDCHVLDAVPCALARAVELADPRQADAPTAALDLGFTSTVLVIAKAGRPLLARSLRGCSLGAITGPLETSLRLSRDEALRVLGRFGIPLGPRAESSSQAARATHELISAPLQQLVGELNRTLGFWEQQHRALTPRRMVLFGAGALLPNISEFVSAETHLAARGWSLGDGDPSPQAASDPLFGVAAALSALAWEGERCT